MEETIKISKALVVYATRSGETKDIAELIAEGVRTSGLEGKLGAASGAFGWSGEAPGRIFDTMKNVFKMEMVSGPLKLKSASLGGGKQMAQDYGKELGKNCAGK